MSDNPDKITNPELTDEFVADEFVGDSYGVPDDRLHGADVSGKAADAPAQERAAKKQKATVKLGAVALTVGARPAKPRAETPVDEAAGSLDFGVYPATERGASSEIPSMLCVPAAEPRKSERKPAARDMLKSSQLTAKGNCNITRGAAAAAGAASQSKQAKQTKKAAVEPTVEAVASGSKRSKSKKPRAEATTVAAEVAPDTDKAKAAAEIALDADKGKAPAGQDPEVEERDPKLDEYAFTALPKMQTWYDKLILAEFRVDKGKHAIFRLIDGPRLNADDENTILSTWKNFNKLFHPDKVLRHANGNVYHLQRAAEVFKAVNEAAKALLWELHPTEEDGDYAFNNAMAAFNAKGMVPRAGARAVVDESIADAETMEYVMPGHDATGEEVEADDATGAEDEADDAGLPMAGDDDAEMMYENALDAVDGGGTPTSVVPARDFQAEMLEREGELASLATAQDLLAEDAMLDKDETAPRPTTLTARELEIAAGAPCSNAENEAFKAKIDAITACRAGGVRAGPVARRQAAAVVAGERKSKAKRNKGWTAVGYKKPGALKRREAKAAEKKKEEQKKRFVVTRDAIRWRELWNDWEEDKKVTYTKRWERSLNLSKAKLDELEQDKNKWRGTEWFKQALLDYNEHNQTHDALIFKKNFAMNDFNGLCADHQWCYHEYWRLVNSQKKEWTDLDKAK